MRPPAPTAVRRPRKGEPGTLEVFVADEQRAEPVDVVRWEALARSVLNAEGVEGEAELSVLFVDEPTISDLNATFMGQQGPTDVLAFPIDAVDEVSTGRSPDGSSSGPDREAPTDHPLLLGDVVVCPAVAARNAPGHAGTYVDELALLIVHGILHVMGMDHATPAQTEVMQARERQLLDRFHRSGS